MNKIFADAEEKYVRNFVVYGTNGNTKAYEDEACTKTVTKEDLLNAGKKGLLVSYDGAFYSVVSVKDATTHAEVTIMTVGAASAATLVTLQSATAE